MRSESQREFCVGSTEGHHWVVKARNAESAKNWVHAIRSVILSDWGLKTLLARPRPLKHSTSKKSASVCSSAALFAKESDVNIEKLKKLCVEDGKSARAGSDATKGGGDNHDDVVGEIAISQAVQEANEEGE